MRLSRYRSISRLLFFTHNNLVDKFSELATKYGLPANQIKIEITESVLVEDLQAVTRVMNHFQELGMQVSIDDFGTGYSSLSYIAALPINEIKIDKSFCRQYRCR